ncbi:hypothetical protein DsansV1_C19g0158351 [Dioscorea sansibarensis]
MKHTSSQESSINFIFFTQLNTGKQNFTFFPPFLPLFSLKSNTPYVQHSKWRTPIHYKPEQPVF